MTLAATTYRIVDLQSGYEFLVPGDTPAERYDRNNPLHRSCGGGLLCTVDEECSSGPKTLPVRPSSTLDGAMVGEQWFVWCGDAAWLSRVEHNDAPAQEPFCACGRVVSHCDGTRKGCVHG